MFYLLSECHSPTAYLLGLADKENVKPQPRPSNTGTGLRL